MHLIWILDNELNKTYALFASEYYKIGDTSSIFTDLTNIRKTKGQIQHIEVIAFKSKITRGKKNAGYLNLKFILSNQTTKWSENYILSLQESGIFKIYLYEFPK